ncbi:MAG: hypothetical protein GF313_12555, partial [Caldithrix sp.]|nr:hypothetical protein [Caldithrix sp.]
MKVSKLMWLIFMPLALISAEFEVQHYGSANYKAITLADMNHDGQPEVIAGNISTDHIEIWEYDHSVDSLVLIDEITGI